MRTSAPSSAVIVAPNGRPAIEEVLHSSGVKAQWYEGSRWSPLRSWVYDPVQDAKKDLDKFTRYELIKHSRSIWKNSPMGRGLIERLVNLVMGSGIHPVPDSSNPEWNKKAKASWKTICKRPCVNSRQSMSVYQRIKTRQRFGDGEGFSLLTYHVRSGRDGLCGLEADRVTGTDMTSTSGNGARECDGVLTDAQGMPISYKVRGVDTPYPAEFVVHHFTPSRDGQERGEPILAAGINTARDVHDILALEKDAVKDASSHKDIIKTSNGELDPETYRKIAFSTAYGPTPQSLPPDQTTRDNYYKVVFGAQPVVLRTGDEYTPYKPDRPGSAWQGFLAFLANSIVLSTGLPPSLLLPVDVGGTDIRRDLELAQRIIEPWQQDLANEWQQIWEYFIGGLIEDGPLMDAPADWREVRWHFPKSVTVDRGRDAAQDRADVQAGLMSREEYHGRYGDDGDAYEATIVAEAKRRRLRIMGVAESEPFKDMREFVEVLSLDVNLFKTPENALAGGDAAPGAAPTKPKPKKK